MSSQRGRIQALLLLCVGAVGAEYSARVLADNDSANDAEELRCMAFDCDIPLAALPENNSNAAHIGNTIPVMAGDDHNAHTEFGQELDHIALLGVESPSEAARAILALTPEMMAAPQHMALQHVNLGLKLVNQHLHTTRPPPAPPRSMPFNGLLRQLHPRGGGASADHQYADWSNFINLRYADYTQNTNAYTTGYTMTDWSLTTGVDYHWSPNFITGVVGNFMASHAAAAIQTGTVRTDGWGLGLYGTYYWESGVFIESIAGINRSDYTLKRNINYQLIDAVVNQTALAQPTGGVWYASMAAGYQWQRALVSVTPKISFNYLQNAIGAYQERLMEPDARGGSLGMSVAAIQSEARTIKTGVTIATVWNTRRGVITPQFTVDWIYDVHPAMETVTAYFTHDLSRQRLVMLTPTPDQHSVDVGLSIAGQFAGGHSGFVAVNTLIGYEDVRSYAVTVGWRGL